MTRLRALDGVLEDGLHLLTGYAGEPRQEVGNRGDSLQVLEERDDRDAGAAEDPCAANLFRIPLDGVT